MGDIQETLNKIVARQAQILIGQAALQTDMLSIKNDVSDLQMNFATYKRETDTVIKQHNGRLTNVEFQLEAIKQRDVDREEANRKATLRNDLHSRKRNVMIHGIDDTGAWEERSISLQHVRNVLKNVLKIEDADNMVIVDCHRLPQRPVSSNESGTMLRNRTITEKRYTRPIIFKLESVLDVQKV